MAKDPNAPTTPAPKTVRAPKGTSTLANLKQWATMYDEVLTKVGGAAPSEFLQGQRNILADVLGKLKAK